MTTPIAPRTNSPRPPVQVVGAQVLAAQQQRLLLMHHASKCPHAIGTCPVTPHCARMKRLWEHIGKCRDPQCQTELCISSRMVLSHYHRCKEFRCEICRPVREAIQRDHAAMLRSGLLQRNPPRGVNPARSSHDAVRPAPAPLIDRERSIQLHMQLLQHASNCRDAHCTSANCKKMKNLMKHGATCKTRGCAICRRISALLEIHARRCRCETCKVPKCGQLKERQQARERAAMSAADGRYFATPDASYRALELPRPQAEPRVFGLWALANS